MLAPRDQWFLHPTKKRCHPLLEGPLPKQERWEWSGKAANESKAAWRPASQLWKGTLNWLTVLKSTARGLLGFTSGSSAQKFDFHSELHTFLVSTLCIRFAMSSGSVEVMCKSQNGINTAIGRKQTCKKQFHLNIESIHFYWYKTRMYLSVQLLLKMKQVLWG